MSDKFLDYLRGLAPEGETLLIVRQKPWLVNGEMQFHADGAVKATWPAFMPTHRMRADCAWYGNTGSFILDRMQEHISASRANCEYVLVLMLDDIGTKAKAPPLPPTWRMETSPGNYQWGYAFREQPTKGEFVAAVRAMAEAGYTDPGAGNPVRNFRLPGSVNLKPSRGMFAARLVEFEPAREYTLAEICTALDVVPGEPDDRGPAPIRLTDDGGDDVVAWLADRGLVYSQPNAEGWMGVQCPNGASHTDGSPEGRYLPSGRAYCCLHSHCVEWDSHRFLDWVAEQGGPRRSPGLREELVSATLAAAIERVQPTPELAESAQALIDAVAARQADRVEQAAWYERFAYIVADDRFFDLQERVEVARASFNALFRHVKCHSVHAGASGKPRRVEASISYDEHRQAMGAYVLQAVTYAAGDDVLVTREGQVYGNRWRNARPVTHAAHGSDAAVRPWLDHVERMIPDVVERTHVLDVMAHKVQHPTIKINHAVLHGGVPGSGKDTMWEPLLWAIGGEQHQNVRTVKNDEIATQWGYHLESEVIVIEELRQSEARDRRAIENTLKPVIAAPPEYLMVNRKGLHPYEAANRVFVLAFTNERGAIALDSSDRRWFVTWSHAPRLPQHEARALWDWYKAGGGYGAVAAWLQARDLSAFDPAAAPPATDAKNALIERGRSTAEAYLLDEIVAASTSNAGEFGAGVVLAPFYRLMDRLQARAPTGVRLYLPALYHALGEAGWIDRGPSHSADYPTKRRLWCAPALADEPKATLRRRAELADAGAASGSLEGLRRVK